MRINEREIWLVQYNTEKNWLKELPSQNWLCILCVEETPRRYLDEVLAKIINQDVCYVCTIGAQCEFVHDLLDEEICYREVEEPPLCLPKYDIITTWHNDFDEGIWFAIFAAYADAVEIKTVIILDMTAGKEQERIKEILNGIENENMNT
ncbi:hypothetical protein ACFQT0_01680 [Hymenobacter humi]|uniref:DUF7684 domain-containing protein n=1 Tax=Hymenobacter humi TaxID=1411620 RepID=A0ABW2TZN7_9BACT